MKVIFFSLTIFGVLHSGELVAVVAKNSSIEQLDKKELRAVYLKQKLYVQDKKAVPINLPASSQIRAAFDKHILRMDTDELVEHWNERHYSGINPPLVQNSPEGVKALVKKVDGAIGYIDSSSLDDGLKVIWMTK